MSALGGIGNPLGQLLSTGIGIGAGNALVPPAQEIANELWRKFPDRPLDPVLLAQGVASGQVDRGWARDEATNMGVNGERFDRLVQIADRGPGVATAFQLWRRGIINEDGFRRAAERESLEPEWIEDLTHLRNVLLSSDELAMMQQQGFISAERANEEAALQGVTAERQQLRFQTSGLPPGLEMAFELLRRSIIDRATFAQIVREGHTKTKYTDELLRLEKRVLSAATYAELHLRGWISEAEMNTGGALTGYGPEDMNRLYLARGRPASVTQGYTAWARGAPGPYGGTFDRADFETIIRQSNIRPEYAETLWHNRFSYPSLFQLRGAVQSGGLTPERALTIMHFQRYEEQDARSIVASWVKGKAAAMRDLTQTQLGAEYEGLFISAGEYRAALEPLGYSAAETDQLVHLGDAARVKKWRDKTLDLIAKKFIERAVDEPAARAGMGAVGISDEAQGDLLRLWTLDRELNRKRLTAAQVKRAYVAGNLTRADALEDLEDLGYTAEDAGTYLDS